MVEVECLAAFDGMIWLRTGHKVASRFNCSQSSVSRNSRKCASILDISLFKNDSEWHVQGDTTLLSLERNIHQMMRWRYDQPLRLEAQHWSASLLCSPTPEGWIPGNFNFLEYHRPLLLLKERVIDAWIASYPDVPCCDDSEVASIPLSKMPMMLVVQDGHPLLDLGERVTFADVARYPILPLPDGAFPKFQKALEQCGLLEKNTNLSIMSKSMIDFRGDAGDLMVGFSSPLTLPTYGPLIKKLPLRIPIEVGDALVVRREYLDAHRTRSLASFLRSRLTDLASTTNDLEVLFDRPDLPVPDPTVPSSCAVESA